MGAIKIPESRSSKTEEVGGSGTYRERCVKGEQRPPSNSPNACFLFFFLSFTALQVKQSSIRSSAVAALSDDDEYDSDEY